MAAVPWKWAVAVTTAPRPTSTLDRTLTSLAAAGFSNPLLIRDMGGAGSWPTWLETLRRLLNEQPEADAYLIVQDDVVFCRELRPYLEATLWPSTTTALCSAFCPAAYQQNSAGWHRQNHGWCLVAAQTWAIPPAAARAMLADLSSVVSFSRVDAIVGRWALSAGFDCYYHTPSLAQHIGLKNSALGDNLVTDLRKADDFVGEFSTAAGNRYTPWTIGPSLYSNLQRLLRPGMRTLECGSGLSTRLFTTAGCEHLALEHDGRFADPLPCVHLAPLSGDPPWYDWQPERPYDLVLIDGPPAACGGRRGILPWLRDLAHEESVFVCNDTERPEDGRLAEAIARELNLAQILVSPAVPTDFNRQARILVPQSRLWVRPVPEVP